MFDLTYVTIYNKDRVINTAEINEQVIGIKQNTEMVPCIQMNLAFGRNEISHVQKEDELFPLKLRAGFPNIIDSLKLDIPQGSTASAKI